MGLLGAIGAGVGAGLESVATGMREESAFQRQMAMLREKMSMESEQRRADKTWEMEQQDARRASNNTKVDAAMTGLIDQKYAASDAGIAAADQPMTQAQLYAIQMSKDLDRSDPTLRAQALASSGVLDPQDSVGLLSGVEEKAYKRRQDLEEGARKDRDFELRKSEAGKGAELRRIQLEEASIRLAQIKSDAKIPPAVKAKADMLREEIKTINKTIYDKEAQNTLTPEGQAALTDRVSKLSNEVSNLYEPYMPKGENGLPAGAKVRDFSQLGRGDNKPPAADNQVQSAIAPPSFPADSRFPHAGYSTIDKAIMAAKGDPRVRAYLKGLSSGDLTATQRQRINDL